MRTMIGQDEYQHFCVRALDSMSRIVEDLGDERANRRPAVDGANSPFALLLHCHGVVTFWVGHVILGRAVHRDRAAEFAAHGPVAPLLREVRELQRQFAADLPAVEPAAAVRNPPAASTRAAAPPKPMTQGCALQHVYTELAQHLGQMEIIRDLILAEYADTPTGN
ncbi:mycothiol transferase [Microbacterium sp. A93]|uniref:mycothiol transferase n=1 Tax=Microbacterium sp. A93 TaxID=3450716 RepID=UPI003F431370